MAVAALFAVLCILELSVCLSPPVWTPSEDSPHLTNTLQTVSGEHNFSHVYHVEKDHWSGSWLILSDRHALKTVLLLGHVETILGDEAREGFSDARGLDARFNFIISFVQINTTIYIADNYNHCIRRVARSSLIPETAAGTCTQPGFRNGIGRNALFQNPVGLTYSAALHHLYIVEWGNRMVRVLDVLSSLVLTVYRDDGADFFPFGPTLNDKNDELYFTLYHGIARINLFTSHMQIVAGKNGISGYQNSENVTRILFNMPLSMAWINVADQVIAVADSANQRVRIVSLHHGALSNICSGVKGHRDGDLMTCQLADPSFVGVIDSMLIIGETGAYGGGLRAVSLSETVEHPGTRYDNSRHKEVTSTSASVVTALSLSLLTRVQSYSATTNERSTTLTSAQMSARIQNNSGPPDTTGSTQLALRSGERVLSQLAPLPMIVMISSLIIGLLAIITLVIVCIRYQRLLRNQQRIEKQLLAFHEYESIGEINKRQRTRDTAMCERSEWPEEETTERYSHKLSSGPISGKMIDRVARSSSDQPGRFSPLVPSSDQPSQEEDYQVPLPCHSRQNCCH